MNNVQTVGSRIPAISPEAVGKVEALADFAREAPQYPIETEHVIHGGMYCRTIMLPAGYILTGTLVKVPTLLTINGCVTVYLGDEGSAEIAGHAVLPASAGRKQAFVSHTYTYISMVFSTDARSIEAAEAEMTDEADILISRSIGTNTIVITEE